jgi:ADP-ribose pyrophosphatase YjhB (NUDIX family)
VAAPAYLIVEPAVGLEPCVEVVARRHGRRFARGRLGLARLRIDLCCHRGDPSRCHGALFQAIRIPAGGEAMDVIPAWLRWARELQAISQTGLEYAGTAYDRDRYLAIRDIAAQMIAAGAGAQPATIATLFEREHGYATPKVDVRAAVFRDGCILMVKERTDGLWTLPGGWADVGDSPALAAVRETREESGFDVRAVKLAAVYDRNRHPHPPLIHHAWKLFFICELLGGEARPSEETEAVEFFAEGALPPLSVQRATAGQIAHMFEHLRNRKLPTSFD